MTIAPHAPASALDATTWRSPAFTSPLALVKPDPATPVTLPERVDRLSDRVESLAVGITRVEALCVEALAAIAGLHARFSETAR